MNPKLKLLKLELAKRHAVNSGYALKGATLVHPPSFVQCVRSKKLNVNTPTTSAYPSISVLFDFNVDESDRRLTIASWRMLCIPKKRNIRKVSMTI